MRRGFEPPGGGREGAREAKGRRPGLREQPMPILRIRTRSSISGVAIIPQKKLPFLPEPATQFLAENIGRLTSRCPICRMPALAGPSDDPTDPLKTLFPITCTRCGQFRLSHFANAVSRWNGISQRQIANASGYIRDNQGYVVSTASDVEFLKNSADTNRCRTGS